MRARAGAFDAMEALEQARHLVGRHADAAVAHAQLDIIAGVAQRHLDAAVEGELQRVRQQVEDDLLVHVVVDEDRLGDAVTGDGVLQPGALHRRLEGARQIVRQLRQIGRRIAGAHATRLDAREVEQGVDQLVQANRVAVRGRQALAGERARGERIFERPQHQRQRRAELVADIGEERRLGAVDLGQRFGAPARVLAGANGVDGVADLLRQEHQEVLVARVELQHRAQAEEGDAVRDVAAAVSNRQRDDSLGRRHGERRQPERPPEVGERR